MGFLPNDWSPIATIVIAIATTIYVIFTWQLMNETRKMRKVQSEPIISIFYEQREGCGCWIDLVIKNIGLGAAYNLKFNIIPDFLCGIGPDTKNLSKLNIIEKGIPYLAPGQEYRFLLTILDKMDQKRISQPFNIHVAYENFLKERFEREYIIDFSIWDGLILNEENPLTKISRSLQTIETYFRIFVQHN